MKIDYRNKADDQDPRLLPFRRDKHSPLWRDPVMWFPAMLAVLLILGLIDRFLSR